MQVLKAVLANRELVRLELVWACACLVRWAMAILIALYAYRTAGVTGVGVAALVRMVPAALLAPRLAVLADVHSRRRVLLASVVARLVLALAMAAVVWAEGQLWLLLVPAAMYGVADSLQKPAQAALLGVHSRNPAELAAANTVWSMVDNVGFVGGSLLVGVVVAVGSVADGFVACVVPLLIACVATARLTADVPLGRLEESSRREQWLAGVHAIAGDRQLRLLVVVLAADMLVQAMVDVLLVIVAIGLLDMGQQGAGWLSTAWGVGGVAGGAVAVVLLARRRLAWGLAAGLMLGGLPLVAVGVWSEPVPALVLMSLLGVGFGLMEVALLTLTQRLVAADVLGRVYGVQETVVAAAMALGSVAASGLVVLAGEAGALIVVGAVLPAVALATWSGVRRLDAGGAAPENVFEILREVFSTLPMATVENLARRAQRVHRDAGEDVVRQGEPGTTFYVIEQGVVEVFEDGRLKRVERDKEFFGEIALLHRVPRTATVRTVEPTSLLVVDQEEFLAAVGAHPRTRHVLHEVASVRLDSHDSSGH